MASPIVLSPNTAYATKKNIQYPGTSGQATAAETAAGTRIQDALPALTVSVASGAVVVET